MEQKKRIEARLEILQAASDPRSSFPMIAEAEKFYIAEGYHQNYWAKQYPRFILLFCVLLVDVTPNLDSIIYKVSAFMTISFIIYTILEKIMDSKVKVLV